MHAAWLIALWVWGRDQDVNLVALAVFVVLQGLRLWILATLGPRWTTRIIVLPGEPLVTSGPYRYLSHPNYAVVAGEIALLPLALHLPLLAAGLYGAERRGARDPDTRRSRALAASAEARRAARHERPAEQPQTPDAPAATTWVGFLLMCLGMFMAILDIQVVATSLPTIQHALAISPDAMSWIQTAYLIAEVIAIPLTGLFTRVLTLRWLFVVAVTLFTAASIGCAFSGNFAALLVFRVVQGFSGGMLIPAVFSAVFLLFPSRLHADCHHDRRRGRGAGADGRAHRRRLDHGQLVVAVAVPDQRHPRADRRASATPLLLPRQNTDLGELPSWTRLSLALLARGACQPRDRTEGSAATRLAVADLSRLLPAERRRGRHALFVRTLARRASGGAAVDAEAALVCGRLRLELLPRRRPVRLGLSDAGVSRLCAPATMPSRSARSCW